MTSHPVTSHVARFPVLVRDARPEDLPAVDALTVRVYVDEGFTDPDAAYAAELADGARRAHEAALLVAELGGAVAGSVTFAAHGSPWAEVSGPGEAEFRMLTVDPSTRGSGVGAALVAECVARARGLGCRGLVLSTQPEMAAAHRLYARAGFRRTPERDWSPVEGLRLHVWSLGL